MNRRNENPVLDHCTPPAHNNNMDNIDMLIHERQTFLESKKHEETIPLSQRHGRDAMMDVDNGDNDDSWMDNVDLDSELSQFSSSASLNTPLSLDKRRKQRTQQQQRQWQQQQQQQQQQQKGKRRSYYVHGGSGRRKRSNSTGSNAFRYPSLRCDAKSSHAATEAMQQQKKPVDAMRYVQQQQPQPQQQMHLQPRHQQQSPFYQFAPNVSSGSSSSSNDSNLMSLAATEKQSSRRTRPISESIASKEGWTPQPRSQANQQQFVVTISDEEAGQRKRISSGDKISQTQAIDDDDENKEEDGVDVNANSNDDDEDSEQDHAVQRGLEEMEKQLETDHPSAIYSPTDEYQQGQQLYQKFVDDSNETQNAFDRGQEMLSRNMSSRRSFRLPLRSVHPRRRSNSMDLTFLGSNAPLQLHQDNGILSRLASVVSPRKRAEKANRDASSKSDIDGVFQKEFAKLESELASGQEHLRELQALVHGTKNSNDVLDPVISSQATDARIERQHKSGKTVVVYRRTGTVQCVFPDNERTEILVNRAGDITMRKPEIRTVKWTKKLSSLQTTFDDSSQLRIYLNMHRCERTFPDRTCLKLQKTKRGWLKILVYPENHFSDREKETIFPNGARKIEFVGGVIYNVSTDGVVKVRLNESVPSDGEESDSDDDGNDDDDLMESEDDVRFLC